MAMENFDSITTYIERLLAVMLVIASTYYCILYNLTVDTLVIVVTTTIIACASVLYSTIEFRLNAFVMSALSWIFLAFLYTDYSPWAVAGCITGMTISAYFFVVHRLIQC